MIDVHDPEYPIPEGSGIRCSHLRISVKSPGFLNARSIAQLARSFHCRSLTLHESCHLPPDDNGELIPLMPDIRHIEMTSGQVPGCESRILALIRACPNFQSIRMMTGLYILRDFLLDMVRISPMLRAVDIHYGIMNYVGWGAAIIGGLDGASNLEHLRIDVTVHPGSLGEQFVATHPRLETFVTGQRTYPTIEAIIRGNKRKAFILALIVAEGEMDPDLVRCLVPYIL